MPTLRHSTLIFLTLVMEMAISEVSDSRAIALCAKPSPTTQINLLATLFPAAHGYTDYPTSDSCFITWYPNSEKPLVFFDGKVLDFERNLVVRLPRTDEWDFQTVRYARWNASGSEVIVGDLSNAAVISARTLKARKVIRQGVTSAWWNKGAVAYLQKDGKSFVYHSRGTYRLPFQAPHGGDINIVADEAGKRFLVAMYTGHVGAHDLSLWDHVGFGRVRSMGYRRRITAHDLWIAYALLSGRRSGEVLVVWPVQEFGWAGEVVKEPGTSRMLLRGTLLLKSIPNVSRGWYVGLSGNATSGPDRPANFLFSADDRVTKYSRLDQLNVLAFSKAPSGNAVSYLVGVNGQSLFVLWRSGRLVMIRSLKPFPVAAESLLTAR